MLFMWIRFVIAEFKDSPTASVTKERIIVCGSRILFLRKSTGFEKSKWKAPVNIAFSTLLLDNDRCNHSCVK